MQIVDLLLPIMIHHVCDAAETDRSTAATLNAYPADPDNFTAESYADRDLERAAVAASSVRVQQHGGTQPDGGLRVWQHVCWWDPTQMSLHSS